jgi:hypothetical protein
MRAGLFLGAVLVLALAAGAAHASVDPYLDQANAVVPCPTAPPGWTNPPASEGGRNVLTPLSSLTSPDGLTEYFAAPVVEVDCYYRTASGKDLEVSVRYALPIDLNPWSDFDIGCTVTGHPEAASTVSQPFDSRTGVYRKVGVKSWSLATFIDALHALTPANVPRFVTVANEMFKDAQPLAHNCSLPGNNGPVGVKSIWQFSFDVNVTSGGVTSSGSASGSFATTPSANGTSTGAITGLKASNFRLRVTAGGRTQSLAIHVAAPLGFSHSYGSQLSTQIVVLASNLSGCRTGSTGTLLVTTPMLASPTVKLTVCGHSYLNGKGSVKATILSV